MNEEAELRRYYAAPAEEAARETLDRLLETFARPVVERVVFRLDARDREDAAAETMLRLAQALEAGRKGETPVLNLAAYAARTAERGCDESLRRRFRVRYNVTKRVQTHLQRNEAFYAWHDLGALRAWPPPPPAPVEDRASGLSAEWVLRAHPSPQSPPRTDHLMRAGLLWCAGALPVETLVRLVQEARNEYDRPDAELAEGIAASAPVEDSQPDLDAMWNAIRTLRPNQARALLLNLRLGEDSMEDAFESFGLEGVAAVLGMTQESLVRDVLPTLPWPDRRIAELLGCTETQVSGLRSSARRALAHRLEVRSAETSHPKGKAR